MKSKIPLMLIYSRIVFGVAIILLTILKPGYFKTIVVTLIATGLLTDIFDGIIARRLKISTQKLRRLDSTVDQFFWLCIIVSAYLISPDFFKQNLILIIVLLGLEVCCYAVSFIKFKKEVATHAISSKIWALLLCATLIQVIAAGNSVFLFYCCFFVGAITRMEIILIVLILKTWTNDVPSIYHAVLIRKGKEIKRHKLFNG